MEDTTESTESVKTTIELTGEYERVAEIIGTSADSYDELRPAIEDMEAVLEIITLTGGATKSRIAEELPADVSAELDADAVIHILRVLELYELVTLDGNTWRPGPALAS